MLEVCPHIHKHRRSDDDATDSGINDQLVKLCPLIDQTCFEFIDVRYFGAVNSKIPKNIYQVFNPIKLFNHTAPSIELMIQCVSNLIQTTFSIV